MLQNLLQAGPKLASVSGIPLLSSLSPDPAASWSTESPRACMWPLDRQITRAQPGRGSAGQGLQARLEAATWLGVVGGGQGQREGAREAADTGEPGRWGAPRFCTGHPLPIFVPDQHLSLNQAHRRPGCISSGEESSPTPRFKSIHSSALSLPHSPTLTSIPDHRKKP